MIWKICGQINRICHLKPVAYFAIICPTGHVSIFIICRCCRLRGGGRGRCRRGGERLNIYDISRLAGVSIATVSRVLNDSPHVSAETRQRVLQAIEQSGYVPNAFARGLGLDTMQTIGLLCPDAADPYLARALAALESALRGRGYDSLLVCTGRALADRQRGVERLRARRVDGLILMGSSFLEETDQGNSYLREAAAYLPLVLLNAAYACPNVYGVLCDDRQATNSAVSYLAEQGCRRVLYLHHGLNASGRQKLLGYQEGVQQHGLASEERLVCSLRRDEVSVPVVRQMLMSLWTEGLRFDGVLCSDDGLAIGALKFAHELGIRVPEQLKVMGYNDSSVCLCCEPELSSVDNRLGPICDQIVEVVLGVLAGREMPQRTMFTAQLALRGSA